MKYTEVIEEINSLIKTTSFADAGTRLEKSLNKCSREDILAHLDYGGVIPEQFPHDSTEEKVFAKYCDALLARALRELGFDSQVLAARGESADVCAAHPDRNYSLVGDAKAFRLSRTAKNQKDFKVEALNEWRHGADYALLLAPIYQYQNKRSQIYGQAIRYNVTLLSYTHLAFMIRSRKVTPDNFEELLTLGSTLKDKVIESEKKIEGKAEDYWNAVLDTTLKITECTNEDWEDARTKDRERLKEQAKAETDFWEKEKVDLVKIDHKTAISMLITALKIDSKISIIKKTGKLPKEKVPKIEEIVDDPLLVGLISEIQEEDDDDE